MSCNVDHGGGRCSWDQPLFNRARDEADASVVARFCALLWYVPWLPTPIRKWGMRVWNARYRAALPMRLRSIR